LIQESKKFPETAAREGIENLNFDLSGAKATHQKLKISGVDEYCSQK
jgi:hypothetical protein